MKLELEQLINKSEYLKNTLEKSVAIRNEKRFKNLNKVNKSKLIRINNLDRPFNNMQYKASKFIYKPFRQLMVISTKLNKVKNIVLNEYKHIDDGKPIIYLPTHMCKYDIELVFETIKNHAHLLSGTEDRMIGTLEGLLLKLNGVNYVDRADKMDRKLSLKKMNKDLSNGINLMIFPEGTWNLSENLLVLPISYSVIDLAIRNDASIELIAFDTEGKLMFTNFGGRFDLENIKKILSPIYLKMKELELSILNDDVNISELNNVRYKIKELQRISKQYLIEETIRLRDELATLKWETMVYKEEYLQTKISPKEFNDREYIKVNPNWDYNYYSKRKDISYNYWPDTVADMVKEWMMTDLIEESDYIFKPKGDSYEFFDEFNSREVKKGKIKIRERISSEGKMYVCK